ncbi:unnamed protein product [Heligmosomoides polygyrus]|uniref:G_PROTEIN_RECEP_F2_3 domain-containing protein n=1 Tax=Heligmosomoides polygyrus TaxID=6339 RepID=A0A183FJI0_HELPZ|nr:unnamed protein product [Heligmosomoides polygyrus]
MCNACTQNSYLFDFEPKLVPPTVERSCETDRTCGWNRTAEVWQENSGKYQDAFYVPGDSVDELNTSPNVPGDPVDVPNTSATVPGDAVDVSNTSATVHGEP